MLPQRFWLKNMLRYTILGKMGDTTVGNSLQHVAVQQSYICRV